MRATNISGDFVLNNRIYSFLVVPSAGEGTSMLTITLDNGPRWVRQIVDWGGGLHIGVADGVGYLWSVRELILLPCAANEDAQVIEVDDDLLMVFYIDNGWVLICETSVRRLIATSETARIELGEVAVSARWNETMLRVQDIVGRELTLKIDGEWLSVSSA